MNKLCLVLFFSFFLKCEIFSTPSKMTTNNIFPLNMKFQFLDIHILLYISENCFLSSYLEIIFHEYYFTLNKHGDFFTLYLLFVKRALCKKMSCKLIGFKIY